MKNTAMEVVREENNRPPMTVGSAMGGLVPTNMDELWRMACMMSKSGMMPKQIQTPEAVAVAVQMGLEVGLSPMAAVQNIAVINGRPSLWGDAQLAVIMGSGKLEYINEKVVGAGNDMRAECVVKRTGWKQPVIRDFSVEDAKKANLWGKQGPWSQYPKRMLQMRARSFALRDCFPDALRGFKTAEEIIDLGPDDYSETVQGAMLGQQQPETSAPVLDEPKVEYEYLDRDFNEAIISQSAISEEIVHKFVKAMAEHFGKTITEVKVEGLNDIDGFLRGLRGWVAKEYGNSKVTDTRKEDTAKTPLSVDDTIRAEFINLRGNGFMKYLLQHKDEFDTFSDTVMAELRDKYARMFPNSNIPPYLTEGTSLDTEDVPPEVGPMADAGNSVSADDESPIEFPSEDEMEEIKARRAQEQGQGQG